jgi:hypothetical protein
MAAIGGIRAAEAPRTPVRNRSIFGALAPLPFVIRGLSPVPRFR